MRRKWTKEGTRTMDLAIPAWTAVTLQLAKTTAAVKSNGLFPLGLFDFATSAYL